MPAEKKGRKWSLYVRTKTKKIDIKLKFTQILPFWKIYNFCFILKLRELCFKVKSDRGSITPEIKKKGKILKAKFIRFLEKVRIRRRNENESVSGKKLLKLHFTESQIYESICMSSLFVGILTLMSETISKKIEKRIIIQCSIVMYFLEYLFKKFMKKQVGNTLLIFLNGLAFLCLVFIDLNYYFKFYEQNVSEYVWKGWNYVASSGCLYSFSQVIVSKLGKHVALSVN